jgi:hypothetical protein
MNIFTYFSMEEEISPNKIQTKKGQLLTFRNGLALTAKPCCSVALKTISLKTTSDKVTETTRK